MEKTTTLDPSAFKPKFEWLPRRGRVLYLCPDHDLHEVSFLVWGYWPWLRNDRTVVNAEALVNLTFNLMQGPTTVEGQPTLQ